jgi:uncharacterized membrane protein YfcA
MVLQESFIPTLDAKTWLFVALGVVSVFYLTVLARGLGWAREAGRLATGFFTNFWDTLGVGSFATTTAIFRQWKLVPDEKIPGTLNVGHTLPTIAQAFIFTTLVPVDSLTLISMIAAAVLGSWLGAGIVSGWSRVQVQRVMGTLLFVGAIILAMKASAFMPGGGTALQLTGTKLVIGLVGNFVLGVLMTMGIGLYAPCMILIYLLGMDPKAAFPIMMGSCAFLMPIASGRFIREKAFDAKAVVGLALGGVPAVLIAALIVKSLPITAMLWLVVAVVLYTATTMLMASRRTVEIASISTADEAGAKIPAT